MTGWRRVALVGPGGTLRAPGQVADELKGQLPVGFLVLKAGVERPREDLVAETVQLVRERIGPVASFKKAAVSTVKNKA